MTSITRKCGRAQRLVGWVEVVRNPGQVPTDKRGIDLLMGFLDAARRTQGRDMFLVQLMLNEVLYTPYKVVANETPLARTQLRRPLMHTPLGALMGLSEKFGAQAPEAYLFHDICTCACPCVDALLRSQAQP